MNSIDRRPTSMSSQTWMKSLAFLYALDALTKITVYFRCDKIYNIYI